MAKARNKRAPGSGALEIDDDGFVRESVQEPAQVSSAPEANAEGASDSGTDRDVRFGVWLQRARQAQKLSLDDVAHLTKIRRAILDALERDAKTELPEKVFVLGYVRSYASCVQVDVEEALRRFQASWGDDDVDGFGANDAALRARNWSWLPPALASAFALGTIWYIVQL